MAELQDNPASGRSAPVRGRSLWADAFSRLRKNRMAMAGLVVVAIMSLLSLFAEYVTLYPATYQQLWVDAKPPGYTHPEILNEMLFASGREPEVPERAKGDGVLRVLVHSRKGEDYRLLVRGSKIQEIKTGAEVVQSVAVSGDAEAFCVIEEGGALGPDLKDLAFELKAEIPAGAGLPGGRGPKERWVLMLRRFTEVTDNPSELIARVESGKVVSLKLDGEDRETVAVKARQVTGFEKDGRPLTVTHWLGTDQQGRDVLSRVIFGGRISLLVGLVATIVSLVIGVIYGAASGYFGETPVKIADFLLFGAVAVPAALLVCFGGWVFGNDPAYWGGLIVAAVCALHGAVSVQLGIGKIATAALVAVEVAVPAAGVWIAGGSLWLWLAVIPVSQAARYAGRFAAGLKVHPYQRLTDALERSPLKFLLFPVIAADNLMMRAVDILYGLPYMFLVILLLVNFGRDIVVLFVALGAVQWLTMARIVRGQVLSLKEKEFIEAARMAGAGHLALLFRHLIPNTLGVVAVYTTLTIPAVILQESFLAFIGLAVQFKGENLASWGALVDEGRQALGAGGSNWWMLVFPSLAMALTLFSLNFLGDGLRDALDPQQKGRV